ncbi:MAG TPA: nuclear transport factor 2 family protein [Myxococcales bacterium]|nr:nuclear transport factor 2 family protein [Myxococcales bacterium]
MSSSDRAIENLLYTYAERIDSGDLEGVASLFAHGCIKPGPDAGPEAVARGRDAVLKMYQAATRLYPDGTPRTRHLTTNAIVEVDEGADRASARSYFTVVQQTEVLPLQPIISGRYHDTFHRIQGVWWFDTRIMLVDLMGNLKQHLLYELS